MQKQFKNFFRTRKGLALAILTLFFVALVFLMPIVFLGQDTLGKMVFIFTFILGFGLFSGWYFSPKRKKVVSTSGENSAISQNYQALQGEITICLHELREHLLWWGYGPLILAWAVLWIGKGSQHPLYSHAIFAIPVFVLAFLAATKFIERDHALDVRIAESIFEGIKLEAKLGMKSQYFRDLANSYAGWNMWIFAVIRVSPLLMILFSLFNTGVLSLLVEYLTQFFESEVFSSLIVQSSAGVILAMLGLFFGNIACKPYRKLLHRLEAVYLA